MREHIVEPRPRLNAAAFVGGDEAAQHNGCLAVGIAAEERPVAAARWRYRSLIPIRCSDLLFLRQ